MTVLSSSVLDIWRDRLTQFENVSGAIAARKHIGRRDACPVLRSKRRPTMFSPSGHKLRHMFAAIFLSAGLVIGVAAQRGMLPSDTTTDTGMGGINSIFGQVLTPSGQKASRRLRVRLASMQNGDRTSTTDDAGNFLFRGLKNGTYTVTIDGELDLEPYSQTVNIMTLNGSPGQEYSLLIRLLAKKSSVPKPSVVSSENSAVPLAAMEFFKKAVGMSKAGDYEGAVQQLELAVKEYPKFTYAYNEMGVQYLRLNDPVKAAEAFRSALKIKADAIEPMTNLGVTLYRLKDFAGAETLLREAIKVDDKSAPGHYFLGEALAYQGKFDEAERELVNSVRLGGDSMTDAHRTLAIIYGSRGDKKKQAAELETYLKLAPNAPDAEQLRHLVMQLKGLESPTPATKPSQ